MHVKFRRAIGDLREVCKIEQVRVLLDSNSSADED
jgi:hypothetical protein